MVIFKHIRDIENYLSDKKVAGARSGFVPTMGALHEGHLSLVRRAKTESGFVVCSIFINPTQFNDKSDYEKYPVTINDDVEMLINAGCDVLFLPSAEEMYPGGFASVKGYDFGYLERMLEGAQRPGHFHGVGQVVGRLLEIVQPTTLYLGQKDYQQCKVITKLVGLMGLKDTKIEICSTMREADGLAMSSRNRRLPEYLRARAGIIYQCLVSIESKQNNANFSIVQKECEELLESKGFKPEYVSLADARDLQLMEDYKKNVPMVALIAARLGDVRLIDNILLKSE